MPTRMLIMTMLLRVMGKSSFQDSTSGAGESQLCGAAVHPTRTRYGDRPIPCYTDAMTPRITDELNQALHQHHGLIEAEGADGKVIVMTMQVYRELMGVGSDEELAASVRAVEEGLADIEAGRTVPMNDVFRELDRKYDVQD